MIYQSVNLAQFRDAFMVQRPDNFTYEGLEVLFDYLENLSQETGENIELDVIALCCDFSEMKLDEINQQYRRNDEKFGDLHEASDYLENETIVAGVTNNTIVFAQF